MENVTHVPSEKQNLKAERPVTCKCQMNRRLSLLFQQLNIHQESLTWSQ